MTYPDEASASAALYERAKRVMPGGSSRATTFMLPYPLYAARAEGARIWDVDGAERLDFLNNYKSLIHGHGRPEVVDAVRSQAGTIMAGAMPTEAEIALAELLVERLRAVEHVRFMNSGSEAVMMAIKAARAFTGREKIAKCEGAYHGSYDYAEVSLSSQPANWAAYEKPASTPYSEGAPRAMLGDVVVIPFNDPETARPILEAHADELACVMIDPIPIAPGCNLATDDFLRMLRDFCDRTGTLLFFDEVVAYRLGYHGFQGAQEVKPDITALGKIMGGGLPVGAVGASREIMSVFDMTPGHARVPHGGTYNANPMTMAAGKAAMDLMDEDAFARLNALGDYAREKAAEAFRLANTEGHAAGAGSLLLLQFSSEPITSYRQNVEARTPEVMERFKRLHQLMLDDGILMNPRGLAVLSTAMEESHIDRFADALLKSLRTLREEGRA